MAAENQNNIVKFLITLLNLVVAIAGLNIYLAAIYDGYHCHRQRHLGSILHGSISKLSRIKKVLKKRRQLRRF